MKRLRILFLFLLTFPFCKAVSQDVKEREVLSQRIRTAQDFYLNKPDSAIRLAQQALIQSLDQKDNYHEGYCYWVLSKAYWVKANYRLSMEYGFKAFRNFQLSRHEKELGISLISLSRTLVELGNFKTAHELIHQALGIGLRLNDKHIEAEAYRELSYLLTESGHYDSALYYADKGISMFQRFGDSLDVSVLYGRKSRIHFDRGEYAKSRKFAYQSLELDTLVGNRRGLGVAYFLAAQNEKALQNESRAKTLLLHSIRINTELGNLIWLIRAHELLGELYLEKNQTLQAAEVFRKVSQYKDSLYNSEKNGQIQEMRSLFELEGKEKTIQLLEQENMLKAQEVKTQRLFLAFLVVGILLLVLLLFFLARLRSIQNKTNEDLAAKNTAIEKQKAEMEEQADNLFRLNQLKNKLFSVISHDLRGPISNLQSLLDLFTKKLMTAEEFLLISDKLKTNLNVTQRTLENLLNWSLSQMDGLKTEKKKIEVRATIEEACRLMDEVANRKNLSLQKHLEDNLNVWADPNQVQLVLRNLIHNAIKFSSMNENIRIIALRDNNHCLITIKDSGIGMTRSEIEMVTGSKEYFTKVGTQQEKGTGLGLLLCKEFIHNNGGRLMIRSEKGTGTEVSFTLMLAEHYN